MTIIFYCVNFRLHLFISNLITMKKDIMMISVLGLFLVQNTYSFTPNIDQINNAMLLQDKSVISSQIMKLDSKELSKKYANNQEEYLEYIQEFVEKTKLWELITRRETMKIVMNLGWKKINTVCRGNFKDVTSDDWGCKYVESALDAGMISKADTFRPNDTTSKIEALKLVLKSKGIQKFVETDNWKRDYVETAFQYGIIKTEFYDYDATPNRAWIFDIAAATIKQEGKIKTRMNEKLMSDEAL